MSAQRYQVVIFDFFNVVHADPFLRWLNKYGYRREGKFAEASRLVDLGHISEREFYERLAAAAGQPVTSVEAVFGNKRLVDQELVAFIEELRPRYHIGLLSNSSSHYLEPILQEHGIDRLFDTVVISADVGLIKPSPEIFELILERMDLRPAEAVFVDDNPHNVQAAQRLGIDSLVYTELAKLKSDLAKLGITGSEQQLG